MESKILRTRFSVVGENVTYQELGVQNLRKFKTFCLIWSATNFQPKLLALP
jgi:hypothetical protein